MGQDLTQTRPGSYVFMNMEVVADILGVSELTEEGLLTAYATLKYQSPEAVKSYGLPVAPNDYSTINSFISSYFTVTSISAGQMIGSINSGNPVMAFVITGADMNGVIGHEITVYSYNTDSSGNTTYNYINTGDGSSGQSDGSNFGDTISITKK